jgi:K+-transporting ATPase ATPase A chain
MVLLFTVGLVVVSHLEQRGNPLLSSATKNTLAPDANMEGKEVRFGVGGSALTAVVTSNTATGSTNASDDSLVSLAGMVVLTDMLVGEVIFGGLGTGLYSIVMAAAIAVFLAGLMVGRTPEYLGKKIGPAENKMIMVYALLAPLIVLPLTAIAVSTKAGLSSLTTNYGAHGLTTILFAYISSFANNGQAFGGLSANTVFYNLTTAIAMLAGRFGLAVPALAFAALFAGQKNKPVSVGTLPTDSLSFGILLTACLIVMTALSYLPALALGPVLERLLLGA